MQKIERYGVIALVVLLVTILAVSLWGESGWNWKFWEKDANKPEVASVDATRPRRGPRAALEQQNTGALPLGSAVPSPAPVQLQQEPVNGVVAVPGTQLGAQNASANGTAQDPRATTTPVAMQAPGAIPTPLGGTNPTGQGAQPALPVQDQTHPVVRNQPAPIVAPTPQSGARTYVVRAGDTLGGIASRELGSSARWTEIQALNGNLDPKKVREGMKLQLPAGARVATNETKKDAPKKSAAGNKTYVVKSGDTLSKIAARELGDGDRWNEIKALNPGMDPQKLKVGQSIVLPAGTVAKVDAASNEKIGWSPRAERKSAVQ
ncbi:MAG: LysM peptidoglycan-binding domain-containing protein [Planctomycetes bacterium]|nr:LysM peptidoglycan-binding domain-containing protein [Planctomycetota bacterium]